MNETLDSFFKARTELIGKQHKEEGQKTPRDNGIDSASIPVSHREGGGTRGKSAVNGRATNCQETAINLNKTCTDFIKSHAYLKQSSEKESVSQLGERRLSDLFQKSTLLTGSRRSVFNNNIASGNLKGISQSRNQANERDRPEKSYNTLIQPSPNKNNLDFFSSLKVLDSYREYDRASIADRVQRTLSNNAGTSSSQGKILRINNLNSSLLQGRRRCQIQN